MLLTLGAVALLLISSLTGIILYSESKRPPNKTKFFRARYTDSVWDPSHMNNFIQVFHKTWVKHYGKSSVLNRTLNNLNIYWTDKRWKDNENLAVGQVVNNTDVRVWRGPRTTQNNYKLNYTALTEVVAQLVLYRLNGEELDFNTLQKHHKPFLLEVRDLMRGQQSEPNQERKTNS